MLFSSWMCGRTCCWRCYQNCEFGLPDPASIVVRLQWFFRFRKSLCFFFFFVNVKRKSGLGRPFSIGCFPQLKPSSKDTKDTRLCVFVGGCCQSVKRRLFAFGLWLFLTRLYLESLSMYNQFVVLSSVFTYRLTLLTLLFISLAASFVVPYML